MYTVLCTYSYLALSLLDGHMIKKDVPIGNRRRDKVRARYEQGTSKGQTKATYNLPRGSSALTIRHVPEHVNRVISWTWATAGNTRIIRPKFICADELGGLILGYWGIGVLGIGALGYCGTE